MKHPKIFYYSFNRVNFWLMFNIAFFITLAYVAITCPCLFYWTQTQVLMGVFLFSCLAWSWKYIKKHKMAVITDESIAIDHCQPLKWDDVKEAKEKMVRCGFFSKKVLVLETKKNIKYCYNFLQKHNCGFTPFSIPLYGILSPKDEAEIIKIVAQKVTIKKLPKTSKKSA